MAIYGTVRVILPDGRPPYVVELEQPVVKLGRSRESLLHIDDLRVSRWHATIEITEDGCFLVDNNSTNGTWLNGERIERARLADEDVIEVGGSRLIFGLPAAEVTQPQAMSTLNAEDDGIPDVVVPYVFRLRVMSRRGQPLLIAQSGRDAQRRSLFAAPFSPDDQTALLKRLEESSRESQEVVAHLHQDCGEQLYRALLPGDVFGLYSSALGAAQTESRPLTLQIWFDASAVREAQLPWELIHDGRSHPVLGETIHLNRYITYYGMRYSFPPVDHLRILYVISRPVDLPHLSDYVERDELAARLRSQVQAGQVQIDVLEEATLANFRQKLQSAQAHNTPYHIVHFDGHGGYDVASGNTTLCFEDTAEHNVLVTAAELASTLEDSGVRLVMLSACHSGTVGGSSIFNSVGPALIRARIPAVLAMQFSVPLLTTVTFARAFYAALARGASIAAAAADGRRVIADQGFYGSWFFPALYLRAADGEGYLFSAEPAAHRDQREADLAQLRAEWQLMTPEQQAEYPEGPVEDDELEDLLELAEEWTDFVEEWMDWANEISEYFEEPQADIEPEPQPEPEPELEPEPKPQPEPEPVIVIGRSEPYTPPLILHEPGLPDVIHIPEIGDMVLVPGGEFIMGSTEEELQPLFADFEKAYRASLEKQLSQLNLPPDILAQQREQAMATADYQLRQWREALEHEKPQHIHQVAPFYISREPIDFARWWPFVEADGYNNRAYWDDPAWEVTQQQLEMECQQLRESLGDEFERFINEANRLLQNPASLEQVLRRTHTKVLGEWHLQSMESVPEGRAQVQNAIHSGHQKLKEYLEEVKQVRENYHAVFEPLFSGSRMRCPWRRWAGVWSWQYGNPHSFNEHYAPYRPAFSGEMSLPAAIAYRAFEDAIGPTVIPPAGADSFVEPPPNEVYIGPLMTLQRVRQVNPRVQLFWHEAMAYCRWVTEQSQIHHEKHRLVFTLPAEDEWEKAMRGTDGRLFSWGDGAMSETTPVSPYGVALDASDYADQFGVKEYLTVPERTYHEYQIWNGTTEWTSTKLVQYPFTEEDGRYELSPPAVGVFRAAAGSTDGLPNFFHCAGPRAPVWGGMPRIRLVTYSLDAVRKLKDQIARDIDLPRAGPIANPRKALPPQ